MVECAVSAVSPSIDQFAEALSPEPDWYSLGIFLGAPTPELDTIGLNYRGVSIVRCLIELYKCLQSRGKIPSWETIANNLRRVNNHSLAEKVTSTYITPSSSGLNSSGSSLEQPVRVVDIRVPLEVESEFFSLKTKFSQLVLLIKDVFVESGVNLSDLQQTVDSYCDLKPLSGSDVTFESVFGRLGKGHIIFDSHILLCSIVDTFLPNNTTLTNQMQKFKKAVDSFKSTAKMGELVDLIKTKEATNGSYNHQVRLKVREYWSRFTIKQFETVMNDLLGNLCSHLSRLSVAKGCYCISWIIADIDIITASKLVPQHSLEFLKIIGVIFLQIGEIMLYDLSREMPLGCEVLEAAMLQAIELKNMQAVEFLLAVGCSPEVATYHENNAVTTIRKKSCDNNGSCVADHVCILSHNKHDEAIFDLGRESECSSCKKMKLQQEIDILHEQNGNAKINKVLLENDLLQRKQDIDQTSNDCLAELIKSKEFQCDSRHKRLVQSSTFTADKEKYGFNVSATSLPNGKKQKNDDQILTSKEMQLHQHHPSKKETEQLQPLHKNEKEAAQQHEEKILDDRNEMIRQNEEVFQQKEEAIQVEKDSEQNVVDQLLWSIHRIKSQKQKVQEERICVAMKKFGMRKDVVLKQLELAVSAGYISKQITHGHLSYWPGPQLIKNAIDPEGCTLDDISNKICINHRLDPIPEFKDQVKSTIVRMLGSNDLEKHGQLYKVPPISEATDPELSSSKAKPIAVCSFCLGTEQSNKDGEVEELISCHECGNSGHPSCLHYSSELVARIKLEPWLCLDCKNCMICLQTGDDDRLMICDECDNGYHMGCIDPPVNSLPEGRWVCPDCDPPPVSLVVSIMECMTCDQLANADDLLFCNACDKGYCLNCMDPSLSSPHVLDSRWMCSECISPPNRRKRTSSSIGHTLMILDENDFDHVATPSSGKKRKIMYNDDIQSTTKERDLSRQGTEQSHQHSLINEIICQSEETNQQKEVAIQQKEGIIRQKELAIQQYKKKNLEKNKIIRQKEATIRQQKEAAREYEKKILDKNKIIQQKETTIQQKELAVQHYEEKI